MSSAQPWRGAHKGLLNRHFTHFSRHPHRSIKQLRESTNRQSNQLSLINITTSSRETKIIMAPGKSSCGRDQEDFVNSITKIALRCAIFINPHEKSLNWEKSLNTANHSIRFRAGFSWTWPHSLQVVNQVPNIPAFEATCGQWSHWVILSNSRAAQCLQMALSIRPAGSQYTLRMMVRLIQAQAPKHLYSFCLLFKLLMAHSQLRSSDVSSINAGVQLKNLWGPNTTFWGRYHVWRWNIKAGGRWKSLCNLTQYQCFSYETTTKNRSINFWS